MERRRLLRHLKKELMPKGERSGKVLYDGTGNRTIGKTLQSVKEDWVFISGSIGPDGNGYGMA